MLTESERCRSSPCPLGSFGIGEGEALAVDAEALLTVPRFDVDTDRIQQAGDDLLAPLGVAHPSHAPLSADLGRSSLSRCDVASSRSVRNVAWNRLTTLDSP